MAPRSISDRKNEILSWVEKLTGKTINKGNMHESLKDGVILCELANAISPGKISGVKSSKIGFMQMENISKFIKAVRELGVSEADNFSTTDLYDAKDLNQVLNALEALSRASRKVSSFKGPWIGAKESERRSSPVVNKKTNYTGGLMEKSIMDIDKKMDKKKMKDHVKASLSGNDYSNTHTSAKTSTPSKNTANSVSYIDRKVQDIKIEHDKVHPSLKKNDWSHTHSKTPQSKPSTKPAEAKQPTPPPKKSQPAAPKSVPTPPPKQSGGASAASGDSYAEIEKLHSLKEKGIITEDEFSAKKKQLLGL